MAITCHSFDLETWFLCLHICFQAWKIEWGQFRNRPITGLPEFVYHSVLIYVFGYQESTGRIFETLQSTGLPDLATQCCQIYKYCHTFFQSRDFSWNYIILYFLSFLILTNCKDTKKRKKHIYHNTFILRIMFLNKIKFWQTNTSEGTI